MANPKLALLLLTLALCALTSAAKPEVWIFSGQSNMQKIGSTAQKAVGQVVEGKGKEYASIYVASPGKPIEAWLDPEHRDFKLWTSLEEKIAAAKEAGANFKGFVWYQGESNTNAGAGNYQKQLGQLVSKVRKATGSKELPVIVVQIAAGTAYEGKDWALAAVREAQRRFVREDGNAALVAAIDVEIGDYTVHLSDDGAKLVSKRVALAADRLGYGNQEAFWGPQFQSARFADKSRRRVVIEFEEVSGKLEPGEGWLAGFGANIKKAFPEPLSDLEDALAMGSIGEDFIYPTEGGVVEDGKALVIGFKEPLPEGAKLSYAPMRNAQYGPHRLWGIEFKGLVDSSGHHAPAFALVPIAAAAGHPIQADVQESGNAIIDSWQQIAVNCIGRFPDARVSADAEAGLPKDGWRQNFWNAASSGTVPNLYDKDGNVTPISFTSGVWYMSPYFKELKNADDALMAGWNKNSTHFFAGLEPGVPYDLALYFLQGPPRQGPPVDYQEVRISLVEIPKGQNRNRITPHVEHSIQVPAKGTFEGYQVAEGKGSKGNVLLLKAIKADAEGQIEFAVQFPETKPNGSIKWSDTTIAGIQIRRVE